jgi:hypothetical protein
MEHEIEVQRDYLIKEECNSKSLSKLQLNNIQTTAKGLV